MQTISYAYYTPHPHPYHHNKFVHTHKVMNKSSKVTVKVIYYTFSDKSITIETYSNDKYSIMYIFWVSIIQNHYNTANHNCMFRIIYNSIPTS